MGSVELAMKELALTAFRQLHLNHAIELPRTFPQIIEKLKTTGAVLWEIPMRCGQHLAISFELF